MSLCNNCYMNEFRSTKLRQQKKYSHLAGRNTPILPQSHTQGSDLIDRNRWVINLTDKVLNDAERSLLEKGMNFAVTPSHITPMMFVAPVEKVLRTLPDNTAESTCSAISDILKKTSITHSNISVAERFALRSLREAQFMILPADKGRATVVME